MLGKIISKIRDVQIRSRDLKSGPITWFKTQSEDTQYMYTYLHNLLYIV